MLIKPAKTLININKPLQQAVVAASSVFGLIDEKSEENLGRDRLENIEGDITFQNVNFSYNGNGPSLKNLNLNIKQGETIALVGPTGSGKTTLVNLLLRFYNLNDGNIFINNKDISSFELESYRSQFSLVDQNVRLFNDSITGNIAFGKKEEITMKTIFNAEEISNYKIGRASCRERV